jgi:hypothetical protein
MRAEELRIGNWISYEGSQYKLTREDFEDMDDKFFDIAKPIVLTEELLLKLGINQYEDTNLFVLNDFIISSVTKLVYWVEDKALVLDSVHQLQNLYFALTGEELTLV